MDLWDHQTTDCFFHVTADVYARRGSRTLPRGRREARPSEWRHADGTGAVEPSLVSGRGGICVRCNQGSCLWAGYELDGLPGASPRAASRVGVDGARGAVERRAAHSAGVRVGGPQPPQGESGSDGAMPVGGRKAAAEALARAMRRRAAECPPIPSIGVPSVSELSPASFMEWVDADLPDGAAVRKTPVRASGTGPFG
jgi:hypothetical protein